MKQLTAYLPDDLYETMTSLAQQGESVNAYIRTAVEAETRRRLFVGMDDAIAAAVSADQEADWHQANTAILDSRGRAAQG